MRKRFRDLFVIEQHTNEEETESSGYDHIIQGDKEDDTQPEVEPEVEEWVWVEGYKGTDANMICRDQQYNIGEMHEYDGDVETGRSGFHLSTTFRGALRFYPINFKNRFFKVQALVKQSDLNKGDFTLPFHLYHGNTNMAAKRIVFLNELTFQEIEYDVRSEFVFVESEQEYNNMENYNAFVKHKVLNTMSELGFSDLYANVKFRDFDNQQSLYDWLDRAKAYVEEDLSKDMLIYLLEQDDMERW